MNNWFPTRRDFWDLSKGNFDDAFEQLFRNTRANLNTDIQELPDKFIVEADMPGVTKENIEVDYQDHILTIKAKSEMATDETDNEGNYLRRERSTRSYHRQFMLRDVDESQITAKFENGVLTVHLPKKHPGQATSRQIEIQ